MKETLRTSFRLGSSPHKIAKTIKRKMLRDGFREALVEVPKSDDTLLIPSTASLDAIEKCIKDEQKKATLMP